MPAFFFFCFLFFEVGGTASDSCFLRNFSLLFSELDLWLSCLNSDGYSGIQTPFCAFFQLTQHSFFCSAYPPEETVEENTVHDVDDWFHESEDGIISSEVLHLEKQNSKAAANLSFFFSSSVGKKLPKK